MIGDIYYDKTVLILRGDSFTDLSPKNNPIRKTTGTAIVSTFGSNTQTGSAISCGTAANNSIINTCSIGGDTFGEMGTSDFTIEVSFNITTFNGTFSTLLNWGLRETNANIASACIDVSASGLTIQLINGTTISAASFPFTITTGTWYDVTLIRSNGVFTLYNGTTLVGTVSSINTIPFSNITAKNMQLLASGNNGYYSFGGAAGYIGGLRLTKVARPAPTVAKFAQFPNYAAQLSGNISALISEYSWDKSIFYPDFSNLIDGIPKNIASDTFREVSEITGSIITSTTPFNCKSWVNDGTKYMKLGSYFNSVFNSNFTIECWVKPMLVSAGYRSIISGTTGQFSLGLNGNKLEVGVYNTRAITDSGATTLSAGTWYKVAVTRTGNIFKLYINNIEVGSATDTVTYNSNGIYVIGSDSILANKLNGELTDFLVSSVSKTSFTPLTATYPKNNAKTASFIKKWDITAVSLSGLVSSTIVDTDVSQTYTINTKSVEPHAIICQPKIDGKWGKDTAIPLNYLVCPTNVENKPVVYKCTVAGNIGGIEPGFINTTEIDGTVTWTKVSDLVDPAVLGTKIPT